MKKVKILLCCVLLMQIAIVGLFAVGGQQTAASAIPNRSNYNPASFARAPQNYPISILTVSFDGDIIANTNPTILRMAEMTGTNIRIEYVINASYNEQLNIRLAGGDLPGLVVILGNTMPIVTAAQSGAFWDITDVYDMYPNLARANREVLNNVSIEGRVFGIYRSRDYPRSGMIYRSDWLENLGMREPRTLDELYDVLYAFTHNNPTRTGANTFGMAWSQYLGPFYNLAVMHGAPNRFGVRNNQLVPWFEYDEFFEAMLYSKRLYDNGLINRDFAATPSSEWALFFARGQAGWHIDVADEASRSATRMRDNGLMTQADFDQGRFVVPMGPVANSRGEMRVWPQNDGHVGYVAISTTGARTFQDLHYHLNFMDFLNSHEGQILFNGMEGINYNMNPDGTFTSIPAEQIPNNWGVVAGLNQFRMLTDLGIRGTWNAYQTAHQQIFLDIIPYAINNPVAPIALMSPTWTSRQSTLNQIIDDGVINFIMGNIDQAGWRREVARWYSEGGH